MSAVDDDYIVLNPDCCLACNVRDTYCDADVLERIGLPCGCHDETQA